MISRTFALLAAGSLLVSGAPASAHHSFHLMRLGWRRDSLVPGTVVTVEGFRSRTKEFVANVRAVKLSDGREVFAGSSFDTTTTQ
jgi:hypothetical protein